MRPTNPEYVYSPQLCFFRCSAGGPLEPRYLYYWVRSPGFTRRISSLQAQTDMADYVNLRDLRSVEVDLPPLGEQYGIAEVLGSLDDKIELNGRLRNDCSALAKELLTGGTNRVRVADVATLEKGLSYKGNGLVADGATVLINLANFRRDGLLRRDALKHYTGEYKPKHTVRAGDLVIANTDLTQRRVILGRPAIVPSDIETAIFTHHVYAVRFEQDPRLAVPLWAALNSAEFRDRAEGFATGTTVAALPRDAVLEFEFSVPEDPAVAERATELLEQGWAAERETVTLATIRDTLLPKLMSGEIRVPQAEKLVEQVT